MGFIESPMTDAAFDKLNEVLDENDGAKVDNLEITTLAGKVGAALYGCVAALIPAEGSGVGGEKDRSDTGISLLQSMATHDQASAVQLVKLQILKGVAEVDLARTDLEGLGPDLQQRLEPPG